MCEKLIMHIFDSRQEAAEYLLDMEYLQRENENKSKNILWNCFGDLIYANICNNLCYANVRQKRRHYHTSVDIISETEKKSLEILHNIPDQTVNIYKEEMDWIADLSYRRGCSLDRELLYILLVLQKRSDGKVRIYINQKKQLTCSTIDKWLGDGVCVCRKGLSRLHGLGAVSVESVKRKYYEIKVNVPEFETKQVAFSVSQRNPIPELYKYNGERKVAECAICGKYFVKTGNQATCSANCSRENRKRNNRKITA